jgi:RNA polymerase sigma-70 factor, ECF subfamily
MTDMHDNTTELLQRSQNGDSEAFSELYERVFTPLYRYIYIRTRDTDVAEDLTQTVFVNVYRNLDRVSELTLAYFYTAARNAITDHWRKPSAHDQSEEILMQVQDVKPGPAEVLDQKLVREHILAAIAQLSTEQQDVITLRFIEGLSGKETAQLLGKSEVATRQLQVRALKALKQIMGEGNERI